MDIDNEKGSRSSYTKHHSHTSKTQFFKPKSGRCHRPGPILRNPYLNFLREFRKRNGGLSAVEIIRRGAREWKSMPKETKLQYIEEAKGVQPVRYRRRVLPEGNVPPCPKKEKLSTTKKKTEKTKVWQKEKAAEETKVQMPNVKKTKAKRLQKEEATPSMLTMRKRFRKWQS